MSTLSSTPEQVIAGVSGALRDFICANVRQVASEEAVVFDSPMAIEGDGENRLSLYLYQMEPNLELRNVLPTLTAVQSAPTSSGMLMLTPAPLAVNLLYMVVVYGQSSQYEQLIAGGVASVLDRCGRVPPEFIPPPLNDSGNSVLNVVPEPATIHMLRDLWAGFPNKAYHLTKLYTVSPVWLPAQTRKPVDVVLQLDVNEPTVTNRQEVSS